MVICTVYRKMIFGVTAVRYSLPTTEQRAACCSSQNEMQNLPDYAFAHAGPKIFNALPSDVRESDSLESYKPRHKTCLFKCGFSC